MATSVIVVKTQSVAKASLVESIRWGGGFPGRSGKDLGKGRSQMHRRFALGRQNAKRKSGGGEAPQNAGHKMPDRELVGAVAAKHYVRRPALFKASAWLPGTRQPASCRCCAGNLYVLPARFEGNGSAGV
jgi:hypothetical protein